jgi:hypothetical protein
MHHHLHVTEAVIARQVAALPGKVVQMASADGASHPASGYDVHIAHASRQEGVNL